MSDFNNQHYYIQRHYCSKPTLLLLYNIIFYDYVLKKNIMPMSPEPHLLLENMTLSLEKAANQIRHYK